MEVDQPPESSGDTQKHPLPNEEEEIRIITNLEETAKIQVLREKVKMLVKEPVAIKRQFDQTQEPQKLRSLLH